MVALREGDGRVRGLVLGDTLSRLLSCTLKAQPFGGAFDTACAPHQFAFCTRAGAEALTREAVLYSSSISYRYHLRSPWPSMQAELIPGAALTEAVRRKRRYVYILSCTKLQGVAWWWLRWKSADVATQQALASCLLELPVSEDGVDGEEPLSSTDDQIPGWGAWMRWNFLNVKVLRVHCVHLHVNFSGIWNTIMLDQSRSLLKHFCRDFICRRYRSCIVFCTHVLLLYVQCCHTKNSSRGDVETL